MVEPVSLSLLAIGVLSGGGAGYFGGSLKSKLNLKKGINQGKAQTELQYQQKINAQKERIALYKEELQNLDTELSQYNNSLSLAKRQEYIIMALYAKSIYTAQQLGEINHEDKQAINNLILGVYGTFLSDEVKAKIEQLYTVQITPAQVNKALTVAHIPQNHLALQYLHETLTDPELGLEASKQQHLLQQTKQGTDENSNSHTDCSVHLDNHGNIEKPKISRFKMPQMKIPQVNIPKIDLNNLHLDNVKMPDLHMPKLGQIKMPSIKTPDTTNLKNKFKNAFKKKSDKDDDKG